MSKPKKCRRCGEIKSIGDFYKHTRNNSVSCWCKKCICQYNKEKRKESPLSFQEFYRLVHLAHVDDCTGVKIKRCSSCEQLKEIERFHKRNQNTTDGYRGICKTCHNSQINNWRMRNIDKVLGWAEKFRIENPERYKAYKDQGTRARAEQKLARNYITALAAAQEFVSVMTKEKETKPKKKQKS